MIVNNVIHFMSASPTAALLLVKGVVAGLFDMGMYLTVVIELS